MRPDGRGQSMAALALIGQLGFIMVACILGGFLVGMYLDRQLGTSPLVTILALLAGVAGGMVAVYRLVVKSIDRQDRAGGPDCD
jgi:F0F1-type ATP synthase assembly protein I